MTRPPRPKYPSDSKNYHDIRKPGAAHTVRLPEELIEKYVALKNALGSRKSHTDVIHFLFEAAEPAIAAVLHSREDRVVVDLEEIPNVTPGIQRDPDQIIDEETFEDDGSECSDVDMVQDATAETVADSEDDESGKRRKPGWISATLELWEENKNRLHADLLRRGMFQLCASLSGPIANMVAVFSIAQLREFCRENGLPVQGVKLALVQRVSVFLQLPEAGATTELQRQRPLKYPELAQHDLAYKLKSWIYTCAKNAAARGDTTPQILTKDVQNAAEHWAGNHAVCRILPGQRKCVVENWEAGRDNKYVEDKQALTQSTVSRISIRLHMLV
ncbi:hypothetical protein R1sor_006359 [Riccia sorocarpa]|uniref:SAP domain-containing protein n=1 Tax=Riccia sorocarpa TaxID=122646 RepID=A0ABD3HMS4_9MARC